MLTGRRAAIPPPPPVRSAWPCPPAVGRGGLWAERQDGGGGAAPSVGPRPVAAKGRWVRPGLNALLIAGRLERNRAVCLPLVFIGFKTALRVLRVKLVKTSCECQVGFAWWGPFVKSGVRVSVGQKALSSAASSGNINVGYESCTGLLSYVVLGY